MVKESLVTAGESKAACDRMVFTMDKECFWNCCLVDLNNAGGLSAVTKRRDSLGLIDSTARTVDGTWADRITKAEIVGEHIIRTKENAYSQTSSLVILYGNLTPDGAAVKKGAILDDGDDISL